MENEKNKIKEPFSPENTPAPPQIIDPNKREDEPSQDPIKTKGPSADADRKKPNQEKPEKKEKQLGESETEITDETTI